MALPIKNIKLNKIEGIETFYNGGKGSGNWGHAGRPGEVGGSSSGGLGEITSEKREKTNLKIILETPGALEKLKSDINTRISEIKQKMKKSTKTEGFSDYTKFDNPDVKEVVKALGLSNTSTYAQTVAVVQILQEKGLI